MEKPIVYQKTSCAELWQHYTFHIIFLGGMGVFLWMQWGPQSNVVWDTNCVVAASLASIQILLYALRVLFKSAGWRS